MHHVGIRHRLHHVMASARLLQGHIPCLLIVDDQVFPQQFVGHLQGSFRHFCHALVGHVQETAQSRDNLFDHLVIVTHLTRHHGHGLVVLAFLLDELAEARDIGSQGRDTQGHALQGRIAPRLIIGREHREIEGGQELGVGHVEDAVAAIKVSGDEHHLHLVVGIVLQA